jgi:hypothetical protein
VISFHATGLLFALYVYAEPGVKDIILGGRLMTSTKQKLLLCDHEKLASGLRYYKEYDAEGLA